MWMLYTHGFNMMLMLMSMKASWSNDRFGLTCQTNLIWFPVFVAKHASLCGWPLKTRRPLWESYLQWLFCRFADSERNRHWTTSCRSLSRRYIHIDKHTSHTSKLSVWTPTHSLQRTFMTHALRRPVEKKKSLLTTCLLGSSFPVSKRFSFVLMDWMYMHICTFYIHIYIHR